MANLFNPSTLKSFCSQYKLAPSKRYGQNYLIDDQPIVKMVEISGVGEQDTVLEIGPGFGVLTFALLDRAKKVYAFEIEKKLEPYWDKGIEQYGDRLEIIWGNVLKINVEELGLKNYKVVANLPYQITSHLIRKFLESSNPPSEMTLMVQKEVAERICARPGEMSLLSVAIQYYSKPQIIMPVPRVYFWPEPRVDSAIIQLKINRKYKKTDVDFFRLVKAGFASKRKTLVNNLIAVIGKDKKEEILQIFDKLDLAEKVRAEELDIKDWKKLANWLKNDLTM